MPPLAPEEYLRPDVLRQVQRLDLKAKFLMEGFLAGLHRSPFKGFSVEFSEHRKYVRGDDVRAIDWKLWSRTNRYFVKQYQAETNLTGYLVVDVSGSMGYASSAGLMSKLDYAVHLAAAMAYLMVRQQDPVGLIACGESINAWRKPRSTTPHLLSLLKTLAGTRPQGRTRLGRNLHRIAETIPHRSLVMIFSDLLDSDGDAAVLEGLAHLRYRGHDVILFHILDAAEANFTFNALTRFEELEGGGGALTAEPAAVRAAYLAELAAFKERFRAECARRRIDFVSIDTATTFDKALLAFLKRRTGA